MASDNIEDITAELIKALRDAYQDMFTKILPIPFIRGKREQLKNLFVEPDIKCVKTGGSDLQKEEPQSWSVILKNLLQGGKRIFIEGRPGYGKSMICLQLAYEWCKHIPESPMENIKVLIFLRLRQLQGIESISAAVKKFLLPRNHKLHIHDIEQIMDFDHSRMIIFDAYDEYPDQLSENITCFKSIICKDQLADIPVITTTRYVPKAFTIDGRIQLNGFNDSTKEKYIRKALDLDEREVEIFQRNIYGNVILHALCENPLLFALFVHSAQSQRDFKHLNSATSLFRFVLKCLHNHTRNKGNEDNVNKTSEQYEMGHLALNKVCLKSLSIGKNAKCIWMKKEMIGVIGNECYQYYVNIGIFSETECGEDTKDTKVKFYHDIFCEWFAAFELVNIACNDLPKLSNVIAELDDCYHYIFRFACGLNSKAADNILNNLDRSNLQEFKSLCLLEKTGSLDSSLRYITDMCANDVVLDEANTRIKQISVRNVMEIAYTYKIQVKRLVVRESVVSCRDKEKGIYELQNGLVLPKLNNVQQTELCTVKRRLVPIDEFCSMIRYSAQSESLKEVIFRGCVVPFSIPDHDMFSSLAKRKVTVRWIDNSLGFYHTFDWQSRKWISGKNTKFLREADYESVIVPLATLKVQRSSKDEK